MYQAVLVEDNPIHLEHARMIAEAALPASTCSLRCYSGLSQLELDEDTVPQIAILDIELGTEENGISYAKHLQQKYPGCQVIFLTGHVDYISDVYDVAHLYLVLKDTQAIYLPRALKKALETLDACEKNSFWLHPMGRPAMRLPAGEIAFFERTGRITQLHTTREALRLTVSLDLLEEQFFSSGFVRCHQSYLVNLDFVDAYHHDYFLLKGEQIIPISRRYQQTVRTIFTQYVANQIQF